MESVVADMIFLAARAGSSSSMILEFSAGVDLLIFFSGLRRSRMRMPFESPMNLT